MKKLGIEDRWDWKRYAKIISTRGKRVKGFECGGLVWTPDISNIPHGHSRLANGDPNPLMSAKTWKVTNVTNREKRIFLPGGGPISISPYQYESITADGMVRFLVNPTGIAIDFDLDKNGKAKFRIMDLTGEVPSHKLKEIEKLFNELPITVRPANGMDRARWILKQAERRKQVIPSPS